jgi:hypothetical protein
MRNPYAGTKYEEPWAAGFHVGSVDSARTNPPVQLTDYETIVWSEGALAGREGGKPESEHEFVHLGVEVGIHWALHEALGAVGGLVGLVIMVLQIPGDTALHPLEDDWSGESGGRSNDDAVYFAFCSETTHPMVVSSTLPNGTWVGPPRSSFAEAAADRDAHEHRASVLRCSLSEQTCGAVTEAH